MDGFDNDESEENYDEKGEDDFREGEIDKSAE